MMKNLWYNLLFVCSVFLTGCTGFLDVVPEDDIETIESDFEKRENAEVWLKSCYVFLTINVAESMGNPAYLGADEYCGSEYVRTKQTSSVPALFIGDGLQMTQSPYCNAWHKNQYFAAIRYCNIFLDNIDGVYNMEKNEKELWKAEVKAVKAFYYFDLMRRYGPIVLVDKNIDANASIEEMMQSRRPIDECVDAIVKLCDEVIDKLPYMKSKPTNHSLYFNKEAVATLKALTLLYAASPLFNGNVSMQNFVNRNGEKLFPAYDKEKWKRAALACDTAILICKEAGKDLVSGTNSAPSPLLNTMMDIERTWIGDAYASKEAILAVNTSNDYDYLTQLTLVYTPSQSAGYYDKNSRGCLGAPIKMVEMFYTEHGVPITEDKQWVPSKYSMSKEADEKYRNVLPLNADVLSLHRRREPRFYAMIASDRSQWYRAYTTGDDVTYKG
ncbi:MAG: RagB/SusD family nutrient uptake outer membrane protein, partial [Butyricimonas faecihominis]